MLIESARTTILSSGLPLRIRDRAAGVLDRMSSIRAMSSAHLPRLDAISDKLLNSSDAGRLARSLVLANVCVRDMADTAENFRDDPARDIRLKSSIDVLEKRVDYAVDSAHDFFFPFDRPILFWGGSYKTDQYAQALEQVFRTGWFQKRPDRFFDVDVVEIVDRLDGKVTAGVSSDLPYRSTISISGEATCGLLRYPLSVSKIFVHEERHIRNNYVMGRAFRLQDISDGFKSFRSEDTGLHSDRTRSNLVGEIDANLEDIRFFLEECGPYPDRYELENIICQFQRMEKWAELIRTDIDPFCPMDPYEPLDPPLNEMLIKLESDAAALKEGAEALKSIR